MIRIILLCTISTHIHDPIHRQLFDDEEEQQTCCITKYSSFLQAYNSILNVIHLAVPFSINSIRHWLLFLQQLVLVRMLRKDYPINNFYVNNFIFINIC
jgi:hypothetical protein